MRAEYQNNKNLPNRDVRLTASSFHGIVKWNLQNRSVLYVRSECAGLSVKLWLERQGKVREDTRLVLCVCSHLLLHTISFFCTRASFLCPFVSFLKPYPWASVCRRAWIFYFQKGFCFYDDRLYYYFRI